MKPAEALAARADARGRWDQMRSRLANSLLVQEGESLPDWTTELME